MSKSNYLVDRDELIEPIKMQVSPNPFSYSASIEIELSEPIMWTLEIYNLNGQLVKTIVDKGNFSKGITHIQYQPQDNLSGMYYFVFKSNKGLLSKPIVIID